MIDAGSDFRQGSSCIRCGTCDGFPCREYAKGESDICAVLPALEFPNIELLTRAKARRLKTNASGDRIASVEVERDGGVFEARGVDSPFAAELRTLQSYLSSRGPVLNTDCRTHEIESLYVVDSSFFPSSSAVNPALTIAAQALRVADVLR